MVKRKINEKKSFKKQQAEEHIHHHNYPINWGSFVEKFFIGLMILFATITFISIIQTEVHEDQNVYSKCMNTCSVQKYMGYKVGVDVNPYNPIVWEYDRTNCVNACNSMYLKVQGAE